MKFVVPISLSTYLLLVFIALALFMKAMFYVVLGVMLIVIFFVLFFVPRKLVATGIFLYAFKDWKFALISFVIFIIACYIRDFFKLK